MRALKKELNSFGRVPIVPLCLDLPNGIMLQGWFVRGFAEWLTDLYMNKEFAYRLMDIMTDIWTKIVEKALEIVGKNIDIVAMADDLGMQDGDLRQSAGLPGNAQASPQENGRCHQIPKRRKDLPS